MPIFKRNNDSVGGEARRAVQRIRRETRLGLFTIRDDRRTGVFEPADRIADCVLRDLLELLNGNSTGLPVSPCRNQVRRAWDASNRFSRDRHETPFYAVIEL